jgi:hypothetical protein
MPLFFECPLLAYPTPGFGPRGRSNLGAAMSTATASTSTWERKAEQARAEAMTMTSAEARALMLDVARKYKQLALANRKPRKPTKQ